MVQNDKTIELSTTVAKFHKSNNYNNKRIYIFKSIHDLTNYEILSNLTSLH